MRTGKTTTAASASVPHRAADYLESDLDIAVFLEEMLSDGDPRAVAPALRVVADAVGGIGSLAAKTGLNRENLYRTLSSRGNPRLDTLCAVLAAFGLRFAVKPVVAGRGKSRRAGKSPVRSVARKPVGRRGAS